MTAAAKENARSPIDELRSKIAAEQAALDRLQLRSIELQEERKAALLADGEEPLEDVEASILSTLRQAERHRARLDAFLGELEAAEADQRHQDALAAYQRAARQIAEAEEWMMTRYAALAAELAEGLAKLHDADRLAAAVNRELPDDCSPLRPPSNARHLGREPDRREFQKRVMWVSSSGHEIRGIQLDADGKPNVHGARQIVREEERLVTGKSGWFPVPLYTEVCLPALERDKSDFWRP